MHFERLHRPNYNLSFIFLFWSKSLLQFTSLDAILEFSLLKHQIMTFVNSITTSVVYLSAFKPKNYKWSDQ